MLTMHKIDNIKETIIADIRAACLFNQRPILIYKNKAMNKPIYIPKKTPDSGNIH